MVHRSLARRSEHNFAKWHFVTRYCGEIRHSAEISSPSHFDIAVAFDDWHCAAPDRQGRLVLRTCFVVMEWRLIEIHNDRLVPKNLENEQSQPEQIDPEDFQSLFEQRSRHLILSVRLAQV